MGDRFSKTVEVVPAPNIEVADFWDLLDRAWDRTRTIFRAACTRESGLSIGGSTSDRRSFTRKSVRELREAFEENHVVPMSIDLYSHARKAGSDIDFVHAWAWFSTGHVSIKLSVSGPNRIGVERFSHDLHKTLSSSVSLQRIAPGAVVTIDALQVSSSDDTAPTRRETNTAPSGDSWLQRRWRDHAATFVITVVGGVLVLIAAAWLGLNPTG